MSQAKCVCKMNRGIIGVLGVSRRFTFAGFDNQTRLLTKHYHGQRNQKEELHNTTKTAKCPTIVSRCGIVVSALWMGIRADLVHIPVDWKTYPLYV